ncbi:hypothetical protein VH1807_contig00109-0002 [Vibrio harveyi]|nr:hypothetical protein VH1807_contig00109-0002 [Vibrio harveyi]
MPISAISPDLALRLYPVRSSEIMNITGVFFVQTPLQIEIDVSRYSGKTQRVNVSLPESLLAVIVRRVENSDLYRDRSHFLAIAARNEL